MNDERLLMAGDQDALESLERKLQVIRDWVTGVAKNFKHGLFLHGSGGNGKSYTVLSQLRQLEVPYQLHNSRMTGKGLFLALKYAPDVIHVLEDMERLTKDADAQGVLRSAMWAQPRHERVVTWTTATDGPDRFVFRGGLILISNRPLADLPELRAMATRIEVLRLEVTEAEQTARMHDLASRGYRQQDKTVIGPDECLEVTEHLLSECRAAACPLRPAFTTEEFPDLPAMGVRPDRVALEGPGGRQRPGSSASFPARIEHDAAGNKEKAKKKPHSRDHEQIPWQREETGGGLFEDAEHFAS